MHGFLGEIVAVALRSPWKRRDLKALGGKPTPEAVESPRAPAVGMRRSDESETAETVSNTDDPVVTDRSYRDENISVVITQYRVNDTDVYAADVTVSSPEYLFSAFARDTYGRNVKETVSETADRVDAILAVNGDFYGSRTGGYVIRNGILYRNVSAKNEDLVLYQSGKMEVVKESSVSAENLLKDGAVQVWSFGPGLLKDGERADRR